MLYMLGRNSKDKFFEGHPVVFKFTIVGWKPMGLREYFKCTQIIHNRNKNYRGAIIRTGAHTDIMVACWYSSIFHTDAATVCTKSPFYAYISKK